MESDRFSENSAIASDGNIGCSETQNQTLEKVVRKRIVNRLMSVINGICILLPQAACVGNWIFRTLTASRGKTLLLFALQCCFAAKRLRGRR